MRVIAGLAKGRRLKAPKGYNTRPTTDRVKETLFNILVPELGNSDILDLFAGSGALGIEALSRGAAQAVFVEQNLEAFKVIRDNLAVTGLADQAKVIKANVVKVIQELGQVGSQFDLVLMDPPYQQAWEVKVLEALVQAEVLKEQAMVVVEHSSKDSLPEAVGANLKLVRLEKYGDTSIAFYRWG